MKKRSAHEWLKLIEQHAENAGDGKWLEDLICDVGPDIPEWDFVKVEHWADWQDREKVFPISKPRDVGIDNVGTRGDGSYVAIQCKARRAESPNDLTNVDLGSFTQTAADQVWVERWVVSNAQFSAGIKESNARNEARPLKLVDFLQPVRTLAAAVEFDDAELTEMQDEAVTCALRHLNRHSKIGRRDWNPGEARGHLVMPCGTGKTRVAYRVMKGLAKNNEITIVLVPSIALVSQIKREFQALAQRDGLPLRTLAVCSDSTAGRTEAKGNRFEDGVDKKIAQDPSIDLSKTHSYEIVGDTATNEQRVVEWLQKHQNDDSMLAIFSTYQSGHNTAAGLRELGLKARLMICDEAHRTAGIKKIPQDGERIRNFTLCHDKDQFPATFRLYQTATPRVYKFSTSTRGGGGAGR